MEFSLPADIVDFQEEFRAYLDEAVTAPLKEELREPSEFTGPLTREFWRDMGQRGYFGLGWPEAYGGGGKSALYLWAFNFEMGYRNLPTPLLGLNTIGPALIRVGSEEQKQEYLPRILSGDIIFSVGYTEPEAGTDLASLQTRAQRDGDEWVISGQKVFTSLAHESDMIWMAVRTDPEAPKHRGISIILVPTDTPGITVQRLPQLSGRNNITFYDDVRVPLRNMVGEENLGWRYITTQLDFDLGWRYITTQLDERIAISPVPEVARTFDTLLELFRRDGVGANEEWTRVQLASMAADVNMLKWLDLRVASMVAEGQVPIAESSLIKVMSNETKVKLISDTLQMLGDPALVRQGEEGYLTDGAGRPYELQRRGSVVNLFGGGSNEVQRDLIGFHGLGLPR